MEEAPAWFKREAEENRKRFDKLEGKIQETNEKLDEKSQETNEKLDENSRELKESLEKIVDKSHRELMEVIEKSFEKVIQKPSEKSKELVESSEKSNQEVEEWIENNESSEKLERVIPEPWKSSDQRKENDTSLENSNNARIENQGKNEEEMKVKGNTIPEHEDDKIPKEDFQEVEPESKQDFQEVEPESKQDFQEVEPESKQDSQEVEPESKQEFQEIKPEIESRVMEKEAILELVLEHQIADLVESEGKEKARDPLKEVVRIEADWYIPEERRNKPSSHKTANVHESVTNLWERSFMRFSSTKRETKPCNHKDVKIRPRSVIQLKKLMLNKRFKLPENWDHDTDTSRLQIQRPRSKKPRFKNKEILPRNIYLTARGGYGLSNPDRGTKIRGRIKGKQIKLNGKGKQGRDGTHAKPRIRQKAKEKGATQKK